jgi:hypothetical protein
VRPGTLASIESLEAGGLCVDQTVVWRLDAWIRHRPPPAIRSHRGGVYRGAVNLFGDAR